jgi:hypothetical protein
MSEYTNCISLNYAMFELDLFDEVPTKYLKSFLKNKCLDWDEYDFEVEITDIEITDINCTDNCTDIQFELDGKSFRKNYRYESSSIRVLQFEDLLLNESSSEWSDED